MRVSQNCSKKASVSKILGSETVNQKPMKDPAMELSIFLLTDIALNVFLLNEVSHLLERCVFDDISSFTIQDFACKESPEYL